MKVAYYPGCTAHSTGLEYNLSTQVVFKALGVEFAELEEWNCCGGAAAHCLSELLGLALPARNIAKAQKQSLPLAIPCPGCFNAVKRAQFALENRPQMKTQLEDVVGFKYKGGLTVKTMLDVMLEMIGLDKVKTMVKRQLRGLKVASYYGCALVRNPKVVGVGNFENPQSMDTIAQALGAEAIDWSYKTDCCGADLGMSHGKIVKDIVDRITAGAIEAGANCIMSSCGLCQINLDMKQTGNNGAKLPVFYFTELLGSAMDLPGRDIWWSKHVIPTEPLLESLNLR
jgi:heterodisulfide reductase subunit B